MTNTGRVMGLTLPVSVAVLMAFLLAARPVQVQGPCQRAVFLPLVGQGAAMKTDALEQLQRLVRQPADFPYDGHIVNVFPGSVTVELVGNRAVRRGVIVPAHIKQAELYVGLKVKLETRQSKTFLLAIFPQLAVDTNYAGKGSVIPRPPLIGVISTREGWLVSWQPVKGADRYRVYRNDTADETSVDEVGYTTQTSMVVGYESPYVYFAVRSVSGLNESELSGWGTDDTPPPVPDTFAALNDVAGHRLTLGGDDAAQNEVGFKCYELEQALDDSGTGAVSLGYFYPTDFPSLQPFGPGVVRYYRARSVDWAGNTSAWSDWDVAVSGENTVQDRFDGYGGESASDLESLWWLRVATFDSDENWTYSGAPSTLHVVQGDETRYLEDSSFAMESRLSKIIDLSAEGRFGDEDYLTFVVYYTGTGNGFCDIRFMDAAANYAFTDLSYWLTPGFNYARVRKSDFAYSGAFDWASVVEIGAWAVGTITPEVYFDDLRIVKADPDDGADTNDTGTAWDKAAQTGSDAGEWHIYEGNRTGEPGKPYSYGQIKTAVSPSQWYLSHKPLAETTVTVGTIQAGVYLKGADGLAGLAFFIKAVTAGSWEMYAVEVDSSADTISLVKWVAGTRTVISTAICATAPDQLIWLGVDFKDYERDGGRLKVYASLSEGNLIQAANLRISTQDTTFAGNIGGSVGVLSKQANVRFVNFVAGSPAHAETADVARALDGPIIAGASKRVRYNPGSDVFEWSTDGETWTEVGGEMTAADILAALLTLDGTGSGLTAEYLATLGSYVWTDVNANPRDFPVGVSTSFVSSASGGWPSYGTVLTVRGLASGQDGGVFQLYVPYSSTYGGNYARYRMGLYNNAGWTGWKPLGYGGGIWKYLNYDYTLGNTNLIIPFNATYYNTTPDVTWSNYRFTINTAGTYTLHLHLRPQYTRTQSPYSWIRVNGGGAIVSAWYNLYNLGEGTSATLDVSCTIEAAVGDYFEAMANGQDPWDGNYFKLKASSVGPPLNMQYTSFSIHRVA